MEVTQKRPVAGDLGRWSSTRRGTMTLALMSALLAAGVLVFALHKYRESVTAPSKQVTVLEATRFIPKGTAGAAIGVGQYFRVEKVAEKQAAAGALVNSASLHGEVASGDIYPGQQLTAADFVGGGLFYSRLPRNLRAVSVPVDTSHGMLGNIQTGDRADVYASFPKEGARPPFVRLLAPDVVVLDAGHVGSGVGLATLGSGNGKSAVVLEVDPHQAGELAYASDFGKVWLVLSPAHGSSTPAEVINEASIYAQNPEIPGGGTK